MIILPLETVTQRYPSLPQKKLYTLYDTLRVSREYPTDVRESPILLKPFFKRIETVEATLHVPLQSRTITIDGGVARRGNYGNVFSNLESRAMELLWGAGVDFDAHSKTYSQGAARQPITGDEWQKYIHSMVDAGETPDLYAKHMFMFTVNFHCEHCNLLEVVTDFIPGYSYPQKLNIYQQVLPAEDTSRKWSLQRLHEVRVYNNDPEVCDSGKVSLLCDRCAQSDKVFRSLVKWWCNLPDRVRKNHYYSLTKFFHHNESFYSFPL